MFNKLKLKAAMVEKDKSMAEVAEHLGIATTTLWRKMSGESEFTRDEIQKICTFLELESPVDIFFA